ncbi:MAG: transposase, partial [Sedimentisphaerales bacterium]|nr:transposase [Sedimentisphaerales bacterium]
MQGSKSLESKLFYQVSLEQLVPTEHLVRRLAEILDLSWARKATRPYYSHTGRPSIAPEVIAKMLLLGFFYNITSERQLMREIQVNLAYRWYLGYDLDDEIPNHSVLSKARRRFGPEFFEQLFGYVGDKEVCCCCTLQSEGVSSSSRSGVRQVTRFDTPYVHRAQEACASRRGRHLLKVRQTCIEGVFGQAKAWHGLARARWRGLVNLLIQACLTATVLNLKKLLCWRDAGKAVSQSISIILD